MSIKDGKYDAHLHMRGDKRPPAGSGGRWMQAAVPESHEGLFTRKAKRAGKSVGEYAQEKKHAKGKLGKEARFALTARKISK